MTDPLDHELLSRVLDDEASPDERAQVAADPELAAQLERLRRTQQRLARPPVPLDAPTVDALVAQAIAAGEADDAAAAGRGPEPGGTGAVTSMAAARRRRARGLGALAAAAAVVLVLVVGASVVQLGGSDDDATLQATDAPATESSALAGEADGAEGGSAETPVPDLGELDQLAEVAAGLVTSRSTGEPSDGFDSAAPPAAAGDATGEEAEQPTTTAPASPSSPEALSSGDPAPVPDGADPVTWCRAEVLDDRPGQAATLRWRGQPAVAFLLADDPGELVLVVSARNCLTLAGPAPAS